MEFFWRGKCKTAQQKHNHIMAYYGRNNMRVVNGKRIRCEANIFIIPRINQQCPDSKQFFTSFLHVLKSFEKDSPYTILTMHFLHCLASPRQINELDKQKIFRKLFIVFICRRNVSVDNSKNEKLNPTGA